MPRMRCPTCGREVEYRDRSEVPDRPFCSERCRLVDLGKWLSEEYRISSPLESLPPTDDSPEERPPASPPPANG